MIFDPLRKIFRHNLKLDLGEFPVALVIRHVVQVFPIPLVGFNSPGRGRILTNSTVFRRINNYGSSVFFYGTTASVSTLYTSTRSRVLQRKRLQLRLLQNILFRRRDIYTGGNGH